MTEQCEHSARSGGTQEPTVEAKIAAWLDKQGTVLELSVAGKFQAALGANNFGSSVDHGRHYRDKDPITSEEKYREIDVVVRATRIVRPDATISLWLILECKSRTKHPWVFYRSSELTDEYIRFEDAFIVLSNRDFASRAIVGLRGASIFNIAGVPYSTAVAAALTKEGDDSANEERSAASDSRNAVRDSILQVLSATNGVSQDVGLEAEGLIASMLIPIVVTKASMFTVTLDESGSPRIESIFRELVVTRSKLDDGNLKYVWVVHESQIDDICSEFAAVLPQIELNL